MDKNGQNSRQIKVQLDQSIANPTWDADGKGLYFMYDEHGNTKIGHTDLNGKVTKITNNVGGTGNW